MANEAPTNVTILLFVVVCLCQILNVSDAEFTHDRKRLGPLDVVRAEHGCLEKFEVSENTIIRTRDSTVLGAKFLNESDVGNREDCFTLCCGTHLCNVAVFEEKGAGSCYLFDCGEPEDFKCKFTSHTTYTSAVLRLNRHQTELGLWSEQSQHEAELANLRSPLELEASLAESTSTRLRAQTTPTTAAPKTSTTTTSTTPSPTTISTTSSPTLPSPKCKRFQFECHSGECIAIYNACDGIPQCQDQSDEDSALGCPAAPTEGAAPPVRGTGSASGPSNAWDNQPPPRENAYGPGYDRVIFNHKSSPLDNYNHYQPPGGGPADEASGYGGRGRGPTYYDYNQRPGWPGQRYSMGEPGSSGRGGIGGEYMGSEPHHNFHYPDYGQPQQLPQPLQPQQQQQQPHQQPQQQPPQMSNPVWMDKPNYNLPQQPMPDLQHMNAGPGMQQLQQQQMMQQQQMGPFQQNPNTKQQQLMPNFPGNFQNTEMGMMRGGNIHNTANQRPDIQIPPSTKAPLTTSPSASKLISSNTSSNSTLPDGKLGGGRGSASGREGGVSHSSEKKHSDHPHLETEHDTHEHAIAHSSLARLEVNLEELQIEAREQDAQASGAVLALAMGVCITALLVVLVGCRLRGVRRRLRKHRGSRSPYAHDADYLVNGMYL